MKLSRISSFLVLIALLLVTPELYAQSLQLTQIQPWNGTPGTTITIYGSGFDGAAADNTVTFTPVDGGSGTTASVTAASATKLTATVPQLTGGNYSIVVERSSDGATADTPELFSVTMDGGYFGTIGSSEQVITTTADQPKDVYAGDVDGDGDIDLISANSLDDEIAWYENDGNFTKRPLSTSVSFPRSVHAADVDGDGDLDILSASSGDERIAWWENDGTSDPNFTRRTVSTNVEGARAVFAADVDSDGDIDLMSASEGDDKIAWYENDGSQSFTEHIITTNTDGVQDVYTADIDGDGDIDILSAAQFENKISWHENNGATDPSFTERVVSSDIKGIFEVYAADVDGDGDLDMLSASSSDDRIAWYENDGTSDPTFTVRTISTNAAGATSVFAADVNGDGHLDVMSTSWTDDKIAWYENDGTSTPSFTEFVVSTNFNNANSVYAADVDGDGDIDLMSTSNNDDKVAWHENEAQPKITRIQPLSNIPESKITVYGSDFDETTSNNTVTFTPASGGSGTTASVTSSTTSKLTVTVPASLSGGNYTINVELPGEGGFADTPEIFTVLTGGGQFGNNSSSEQVVSTDVDGAQSVYAGDVNDDGFIDLMTASENDDKIAWHENDGNQSFTEQGVSHSVAGPQSVYAADVDGDGDLDMLSASVVDNRIAWYENDGSSTLTRRTISTNATGATSVFAADMDGDGDLDIVSASEGDNKIAWYENHGTYDFTEHVVTTSANGAQDIHAADVNGDGHMDLLSASVNDDKIAWFENDGNQSFTEHGTSHPVTSPQSVNVGDVDGDGDLDLMSASSGDDRIAWFENDGSSTPIRRTISTNASGATSVFGADMDGDGDLDIASASEEDDKIAWYENDGNQSFTEHIISTNADGAQSIYAADVDDDGDLDLMSASSNDNKIVWYENISISIGGHSLSMDGSGGQVEVPHSSVYDDLSTITVEAWVQFNTSNRQGIIEKHESPSSGWWIDFNTDISAVVVTQDGSRGANSSIDPELNTWNHVAVLYDGTDVKIYLNGKLTGESDYSSTGVNITNNSRSVVIGALNWTTANFDGKIDEVRIWNTARSAQQIRNNMFQSLNGDETGLIGYYPFNEENTSQAFDGTSGNNTGTLQNGTTRSTDTHPYGTVITGSEGWHMMSAPVNASYSTLLDTLWTQGFTGADKNNPGDAPNVFTWDEAAGDWAALGNASNTPATGTGFISYVYNDQDFDGTDEGFPKIIKVDNNQNSGTVSPTLTFTDAGVPEGDGWNLVGNPYGATINWDVGTGWSRNNLDGSIYVWNKTASEGAGAYQAWNGESGTLGDGLIAPWQGFWVKANGSNPSLSFNDDVRSAGGVFLKDKPAPQIKLKLEGTELSSEAVVMFSKQASPDKDSLDAWKLESLNQQRYLSLYTTNTKRRALDINALPKEPESPLELNLNFRGSHPGGEYTLSWDPQDLPETWNEGSIKLIDLHTDRILNLNKAGEYRFEVAKAKTSKVSGSSSKSLDQASTPHPPAHGPVPTVLKAKTTNPRFMLTINPDASGKGLGDIPEETELVQNYPNPFNPETVIRYGVPEQADVQLNVYDVLGRKVRTLINEQKSAGRYEANFNASELASGLYFYRLKVGTKTITKKMMLIK